MTKTTKIEGYLIQAKLESALIDVFGIDCFIGREISCPDSKRKKFDMQFNLNNRIITVEFDGDLHYKDSLLIRNDEYKSEQAKKHDWNLIRIPYYVQLTNETFQYYFGKYTNIEVNIQQDFPHGFIETKVFPASFCSLGLDRYYTEMSLLPNGVQRAINKSLMDKINEYGERYVIPTSQSHLNH